MKATAKTVIRTKVNIYIKTYFYSGNLSNYHIKSYKKDLLKLSLKLHIFQNIILKKGFFSFF